MAAKKDITTDADATAVNETLPDDAVLLKSAVEKPCAYIYIGPTLPGGRLKSNAILTGTHSDIKAYFKDALASYPNAAKLIVPITQLSVSQEKARTPGNILHKYYNDIVAAAAKKDEV